MLNPWYLLSSQSYHVKRAIHEAPHQDLGAIFSSNYIIGTVVRGNIPQLDLGSLSQPLLPGVSGAQSCGVQTSAFLHTCTLVTHHLAKSEEGLGGTFSCALSFRLAKWLPARACF